MNTNKLKFIQKHQKKIKEKYKQLPFKKIISYGLKKLFFFDTRIRFFLKVTGAEMVCLLRHLKIHIT